MPILPTRATLLCTELGALRGWGLVISCPCRAYPRHLAVEALVEGLGVKGWGGRATLESILARLRCERCGAPPSRVEAKQGDPSAKRGTAAVVLLESKAATGRNRG